MSENFLVSDVNDAFGGNSVKLTMSGSGCYEWSYLLKIIKYKKLKTILCNIDPVVFERPYNEFRFELPEYLYDYNHANDLNYLLNFSVLNNFTLLSLRKNLHSTVNDYNTVYSWNKKYTFGKETVLKDYKRPDPMFSKDSCDIRSPLKISPQKQRNMV